MLRVAIISPLPPQESGEAPYTAQLITKLAETGKTRILAIAGEKAQLLPDMQGVIETKPVWKNRSMFYPITLARLITKWRPHITHVQFGPHGRDYGGLFGEIMLILLLILRMTGIRTTVTLHSSWMPDQAKGRVMTYRRLKRLSFLVVPVFKMYMRVLGWVTNSIQLSTAKTHSTLRKKFLNEYGLEPRRILEIPHPCSSIKISIKMEAAKMQLKLAHRKIILVFGFIRPGKGIDTAIKALYNLRDSKPEALLLIAGKPSGVEGKEYLKELKLLRQNLSLEESVLFHTKFIPEDLLPVYFSAASIVLVPYSESVGVSGPIHNFAGYGTPIVASNVGFHMGESLGGNLVLFKTEDSNDLARNLEQVLANKTLAEGLSKNQVEYAQRENWDLAARRTLANYIISCR